ncbi:MAG: hypothetical protein CL466_13040 [Acidimicrobiaceae bacterium]|nr:hypothetical protein [Acidimicrobiaceae bacterium]MBJ32304.1 hypothetical protein [Acidimicrobiaceae bacterium]
MTDTLITGGTIVTMGPRGVIEGNLYIADRGGLHSSPHSGGDPISDLVYAHQLSDVTTVLVDGAPIVVDRGLVAADRAEIVADAEQRRAELIARLD